MVGAGYIGLEMDDALTVPGLHVTQVEALPQVLPTVDAELAQLVQRELAAHGVEVLTGTTVTALVRDGDRVKVTGEPGLARSVDLVLAVVGVKPDTTLARTAGRGWGCAAPSSSTSTCAPACPTCSPLVTACTPTTGCSPNPDTCCWAPPRTSRAASPVRTRLAVTRPLSAASAPRP